MPGPTQLNLILACGLQGQIGQGGGLPWVIPEELAFFKGVTIGHPVIMGRKTFESIGAPLPGRRNLIVSSRLKYVPGAECVGSLSEALARLEGSPEAFVIGGIQLWTEALPLADLALISQVEYTGPADTSIPAAFFTDLHALYYMAAMDSRDQFSVTYWKRVASPLYANDQP